MPMQPLPPEENQPGPKSAERPAVIDEPISPPVNDDDPSNIQPEGDPPADPARGEEDDDETKRRRQEPQKPPSDQARDQIAARFAQSKTHDAGEGEDGDEQPGADDDSGGQQQQDGGEQSQQQPTDRLTLKVFGKDVEKSIDEIAVLADMTPDEVRENPERAARFAQKELASTARLEESRRILRETTNSRAPTDEQHGADRRAPNQGRSEAEPGAGSDQQEQPSPTKGKVDFKALVETLQIEDPEKAAEALEAAFSTIAESAKTAASASVSESDFKKKVDADRADSTAAVKQFKEANPDLAKNRYAGTMIASGLADEYREDLVKALVAEGDDQDEAERLVKSAPDHVVAEAHAKRRVAGDPNVRRIDTGMIEKAFGRVSKALGVKISKSSSQQELASQRQERKANLTPQPRRASVPPATNQPAPKVQSRSSAVAELAASRGQKNPSSPR